ncbi:MAG: thioesterase family protein [Candidatus Anammoximicrobium sp.]|nr:thioesterase family protein [Candidatus Anammoximicrobium sp.]
MKAPPKIGDAAEIEFVVDGTHVIDFADDQMPAVLSTPCLIGYLERTARKALAPVLDAGERSVGVHVDVRHLAPTPPGQRVVCTARVIHVDGPVVSFQVQARDQRELIARGLHKRRVIRTERFAAHVRRKENG